MKADTTNEPDLSVYTQFAWKLPDGGESAHVPYWRDQSVSCCGVRLSGASDAPPSARCCLRCADLAPSLDGGWPRGVFASAFEERGRAHSTRRALTRELGGDDAGLSRGADALARLRSVVEAMGAQKLTGRLVAGAAAATVRQALTYARGELDDLAARLLDGEERDTQVFDTASLAAEDLLPETTRPGGRSPSRETWYDEEIAPALAAIGERCVARGMAVVAVVEFDPGQRGRTVWLPVGAGLEMVMLNHCSKMGTDIDGYVIGLRRYARNRRIDFGGSVFMSHDIEGYRGAAFITAKSWGADVTAVETTLSGTTETSSTLADCARAGGRR